MFSNYVDSSSLVKELCDDLKDDFVFPEPSRMILHKDGVSQADSKQER